MKNMKEKIKKLLQGDRRALSLVAIVVVTLLLLLIGGAYAYFASNASGGTKADINASTGTTDSLTFSVGKDINLNVTIDDFQEGMESPHGETTATATLRANNGTNQAKGKYNVFFIIDNNDFEYSTLDGQAELLMKVTDPNGKEVENITGLKKVEGGFDITTCTGSFLISADNDIETTSSTSKTWTIEVTFVNLDANQNKNKGKTFNGKFYITTEQESTHEAAKINSIETNATHKSITVNLNYFPGSAEIETFYYAIEKETLPTGTEEARLATLGVQEINY
ncbi:MAG: hypothetical protein K2M17_06145, partial [Bacilli bacterium]|nr:hypothetical protein [Bacilli bacterium]